MKIRTNDELSDLIDKAVAGDKNLLKQLLKAYRI